MAKPKTNLIIEEDKYSPNLLKVWTPKPILMIGRIEAIKGVVRVFHNITEGYLNVWLNPCYDGKEITAEIRTVIPGIK